MRPFQRSKHQKSNACPGESRLRASAGTAVTDGPETRLGAVLVVRFVKIKTQIAGNIVTSQCMQSCVCMLPMHSFIFGIARGFHIARALENQVRGFTAENRACAELQVDNPEATSRRPAGPSHQPCTALPTPPHALQEASATS